MKQYVIDQLALEDMKSIHAWLTERYGEPSMGGLWWVPLDPGLLNETQKKHTDCHPLVFAVDLDEGRLSCELLVRTMEKMRCDCMGYASGEQFAYIVNFTEAMLAELGIPG